MKNGISIYLGLDNTIEENLHLIRTAHTHGIGRIFTSLHIPETDVSALQSELQTVLKEARQYNMEVISDVSPNTLSLLNLDGLDTEKLQETGINTIRLDFGYGEKEIAELSRMIKIQFNASTITKDFLDNLKFYRTDFYNIDALHNFYPREGTGLSEEFLLKQNRLLHDCGIQTAAFVPSYNRARSPLRKGLPTLEKHRYKQLAPSAQHLLLLETDSVFIGDSLPTETEIQELAELANDCITIRAECLTQNEFVKNMAKQNVFTARADSALTAIRVQESRSLCRKEEICPEYITRRSKGMITLDNSNSGRYKGEMQIILQEQPADRNVNVIGKVADSDMILLKFIKSNSRFKIKFI